MLKDDSRVKGSSLDRCEQLVLRPVHEVPAKRDSTQFWVYEDGAIPVVPGETKKPGSTSLILRHTGAKLFNADARSPGNGFKDVSDSRALDPVGKPALLIALVSYGETGLGHEEQTPANKIWVGPMLRVFSRSAMGVGGRRAASR